MEGVEIPEIVEHFKALGRPRTYLQIADNVQKSKLPTEGRVDRNRPWTPEEDAILIRKWNNGMPMDRLRLQMLRVVPNLTARLQELGLPYPDREGRHPSSGNQFELACSKPWGPATKRGSHYLGEPAR